MSITTKSESGYVLVVLAFSLLFLLGFAALAVDTGMMYSARTSAQRAADAAALAGAYLFVTAGPNETAAQLTAQATNQATDTAIRNTILGKPIQSSELTPAINVDVPNRRVTVSLTHTINTFFAGVLGQKFATVSVVAVAEAGPSPDCADCIKPWFLPNNILAPNSGSASGCGACTGDQALLINALSGAKTTFANNYLNTNTPFTVHPQGGSASIAPGDYFSIVLNNDNLDVTPGSNGANVYRDNIALCNPYLSIKCGDAFRVKPGAMVGPTKQGTSLFISFYNTDQPNQIAPWRDQIIFNGGQITYNGPSPASPPASSQTGKTSSHQLVTAPIFDVCAQACPPGPYANPNNPPSPSLPGGTPMVTVIGFAKIFIADVDNSSNVTAYFVDIGGCGSAPAGCGGSSVLGYPLRLVRMN